MFQRLYKVLDERFDTSFFFSHNTRNDRATNQVSGMATPIAFATPVCAIAFSGKSWGDNNLLKNEISARKAALSGCFGGGASVRV